MADSLFLNPEHAGIRICAKNASKSALDHSGPVQEWFLVSPQFPPGAVKNDKSRPIEGDMHINRFYHTLRAPRGILELSGLAAVPGHENVGLYSTEVAWPSEEPLKPDPVLPARALERVARTCPDAPRALEMAA